MIDMVETVNLSNDEETLKKLKEVSFFSKFANNDDILKKIAEMCTKKHFPKDMMIIKEGDTGDELFIMLKERVEIKSLLIMLLNSLWIRWLRKINTI